MWIKIDKEKLNIDPLNLISVSGEQNIECETLSECTINREIDGKTYVMIGVRGVNMNRSYAPEEAEIKAWLDLFGEPNTLTDEEYSTLSLNFDQSDGIL